MLTIRELIRTLYNAFNQKLKSHRGNWEQNDPTADDYIKNRPFYTDGYTTVIKEKTFSTPESYYWCSPFVFEPKEGETYIVVWDGKEYECISYVDSYGYLCIGNYSLAEDGKNTGEPFFYCYYDYGFGDIEYFLVVKNSGVHIVSISKPNVIQIDKKYIPEINTVGIKGIGYNAEVFNGGGNYQASGTNAHAEGYNTIASGDCAHAEGCNTTASGGYSHAEGQWTVAAYTSDHAEGSTTIASGSCSHAEGHGTIAGRYAQHAQGKYNIEDTTNKYAHIVGNGTNSNFRSNAHTIDWDGNAWFAGDVYVGGSSQNEGEKLAKQSTIPNNGNILNGTGTGSVRTLWSSQESDIYKLGYAAFAEGYATQASGKFAHAEGESSIASNECSHAEGCLTRASGTYSHAEGKETVASSHCAHAEGFKTKAWGIYSHAEGQTTEASGNSSHAEGCVTQAFGAYSHAEGQNTIAKTRSLNVIGEYNLVNEILVWTINTEENYQMNRNSSTLYTTIEELRFDSSNGYFYSAAGMHGSQSLKNLVVGDVFYKDEGTACRECYEITSIPDDNYVIVTKKTAVSYAGQRGKYVHVVGNGIANAIRSNAHTLDWNGNAWFQGEVRIGGTGQDDANAKTLATEEYVTAPKSQLTLIDQETGENYIVCIKNGSLVTYKAE